MEISLNIMEQKSTKYAYVAIQKFCVHINCEKKHRFPILIFENKEIKNCAVYMSRKSVFKLLPIAVFKYN